MGGRHSAVADNTRLRQARREDRQYINWCHERFADLGRQVRSWKARAEVAEGRLLAADQLVQRQVDQLMERDSLIEQLRRQVKAASDDTVEVPIVAEAELAGVA